MEWTFVDIIWSMVVFFFWFMVIWMFIGVFGDIFRRDDMSGWAKAGWIALIFFLPFLGILVYMIARPRMTEQDKRLIAEAQGQQRRLSGYSAVDEIAKAAQLRDAGTISSDEFEVIKRHALA